MTDPDPGWRTAIEATERWLVRRGLPHFIDRYNASEDVLTRAAPALTAVVLLEAAVNAPSAEYPVLVSGAAVLGALAIVVTGWALTNRWRRRPTFSRPARIGPVEVLAFVVLPALVPLAFDAQWRSALVTAGVNVLLLAVAYGVTSYGLVPLTRWGLGLAAREVLSVVTVLVRALPLLLLVVVVVFVNTEAWQVASGLRWPGVLVLVALFLALGFLFAVARIPRQLGELVDGSTGDLQAEVAGTPAEGLLAVAEPVAAPELTRREWGNVGLVVLASEGVLVALVSALMMLFLVVFGVLAVTPAVIEAWLGHPPDTWVTVHLFDQRLALTGELVKVAAFLAAFSGLSFTVSLLSDQIYQQEFMAEIQAEVRRALAVRSVYRSASERSRSA